MSYVRIVKNDLPRIIAGMAVKAKVAEHETAQAIVDTFQASAPVGGADDPYAGRFRDSMHAEGNRAVNDDPTGKYKEFGTSDTPTFATFRQSVDVNRGTFVEKAAVIFRL